MSSIQLIHLTNAHNIMMKRKERGMDTKSSGSGS